MVTDSTADITPVMAAEHDIEVVPLSVSFGEETLPDGQLTQQQFFERMQASPQLPTTSQPSVGAFAEVYARTLERLPEVISLHIASTLSGTFESARRAAEQFEGRVHVVDSLTLTWPLAFQVMEAAASAAEGVGVTQALARINDVRERARLLVGLDSLENLQRGGRIGRVSAFLGSLLNLKVTFEVRDGEFIPLARSRGERAALALTMDWVAKQMGSARRGKFAVGYALDPPRAQRLADAIRSRWEVVEMVIYATGSVIATHTGTGWGVTVVPERA